MTSSGFTPAGQSTLGDIKYGYITCPYSPAQSKSMSLTSLASVIMTFGVRDHTGLNCHCAVKKDPQSLELKCSRPHRTKLSLCGEERSRVSNLSVRDHTGLNCHCVVKKDPESRT